MLLISPERLANPRFAAQLPTLLHACGSAGDRRGALRLGLGLRLPARLPAPDPYLLDWRPDPVLATTATANDRVTVDVAAQLGDDTVTLRGSLARASLRLAVVPRLSPLERYAWVAEALRSMPGLRDRLRAHRRRDRAGGRLPRETRGSTSPPTRARRDDREELEDRLRRNEIKALVATSALGMGYDKPDLAFCIHLGSPASPVAYYQQVGRAGRALDDATAVLVPAESDERIWEYFATAGIPDEDQVERVLDALADRAADGAERSRRRPASGAAGSRRCSRSWPSTMSVVREQGGWIGHRPALVSTTAKWADLRRVRAAEADLMRRYAHGAGCLMRFLQEALDDPDPAACGRCSVCTGRLPAPGPDPDGDGRGGPTVLPRPGRGDRAAQAVAGRAARPQGQDRWPGAGPRPRVRRRPGLERDAGTLWQRDEAAPQEMLAGIVEVLRRWSRTWERPVAVVPMPSRRFPARWSTRSPLTWPRSAGCRWSTALAVTGPAPNGRLGFGGAGARICSTRPRCVPVLLRRPGAAGGRHGPQPVDHHRGLVSAGRGRRDRGLAARRPSAAVTSWAILRAGLGGHVRRAASSRAHRVRSSASARSGRDRKTVPTP